MQDSINMFRSLLNHGVFCGVTIYILLNKVDLFRHMISRIPISDYFPDYTGGADCFNACKFFADNFMSIGKYQNATTNIFPMSAVDSESVRDVWLCIRDLLKIDSTGKPLSEWAFGDSGLSERHSPERVEKWTTAWSWAEMDPDLIRERRSYMKTVSQSDAQLLK